LKAIDKIKKLLALSKSPNESEAAVALAKAMKIASSEGIDIDKANAAILNEDIEHENISKARLKIPKWEVLLGNGIAKLFGCRMIRSIKMAKANLPLCKGI
jgi:hypothetical protein